MGSLTVNSQIQMFFPQLSFSTATLKNIGCYCLHYISVLMQEANHLQNKLYLLKPWKDTIHILVWWIFNEGAPFFFAVSANLSLFQTSTMVKVETKVTNKNIVNRQGLYCRRDMQCLFCNKIHLPAYSQSPCECTLADLCMRSSGCIPAHYLCAVIT